MAEQGLSWYLFGAQAAIMWGSPRLSADADVTVDLEPERVDPFIEAMRRHGFELVFSDSDFIARTRVIPFIHHRTRMPVDIAACFILASFDARGNCLRVASSMYVAS